MGRWERDTTGNIDGILTDKFFRCLYQALRNDHIFVNPMSQNVTAARGRSPVSEWFLRGLGRSRVLKRAFWLLFVRFAWFSVFGTGWAGLGRWHRAGVEGCCALRRRGEMGCPSVWSVDLTYGTDSVMEGLTDGDGDGESCNGGVGAIL